MYNIFQASGKPFTAEVLLSNKSYHPQKIKLVASDVYKPYTLYSERVVSLNGQQERNITLSFPVSPNYMEIYTYNMSNSGGGKILAKQFDMSYSADVIKTQNDVRSCDVWMDAETQEYTEFAEWFAINAGLLSYMSYDNRFQLQPYSDYRTNDGKFNIRYMPYLPELIPFTKTIVKSNSPARVGHDSGRVEASREHFIRYSVPQRFLILLHEFSHKYGNKKINRQIDDENGADFLALYIYLGKGYPRYDALDVFLNIFYKNPTEGNINRAKMIERFINDFDSGKINNLINCKTK
jgi:hypothetical protein